MKRHVILVAVLAMAACAGDAPRSTSRLLTAAAAEAPRGAGCTDPAEFGAHPDDGVDDRPLIQAYLDSQPPDKCISLCFGPGMYEITRTGGDTHRRIAGLSLERSCLTLSGAGQATVLMGTGPGGGPQGDFSVLSIKAPNNSAGPIHGVTIENLRVSGDNTYDTGEQTHVIEVGGRLGNGRGVEQVVLRHLWLDLPPREKRQVDDAGPAGWERRGDCIRLVGSAAAPTGQIQIQDSVFTDCDRSSIGIQRHTYDLIVTGNLFLAVGDQHIDQEPTGTGGISRSVYANNIFRNVRPGNLAVTLTGNDTVDAASEIIFQGNLIEGRGIMLYNLRRALIANNTITAVLSDRYGSQGLIQALKVQDHVAITGNVLRRAAGSPPGPVIRAAQHGTGLPGPLLIANNLIEQETEANAIDLDSVLGAEVTGNSVSYGGAPSSFAAVILRGTASPIDGVLVSQNRVTGPLGYLLRLAPAGNPVGAATMTSNASWGVGVGLRCEAGAYEHPLVASANLINGGAAASGCAAMAQEMP